MPLTATALMIANDNNSLQLIGQMNHSHKLTLSFITDDVSRISCFDRSSNYRPVSRGTGNGSGDCQI